MGVKHRKIEDREVVEEENTNTRVEKKSLKHHIEQGQNKYLVKWTSEEEVQSLKSDSELILEFESSFTFTFQSPNNSSSTDSDSTPASTSNSTCENSTLNKKSNSDSIAKSTRSNSTLTSSSTTIINSKSNSPTMPKFNRKRTRSEILEEIREEKEGKRSPRTKTYREMIEESLVAHGGEASSKEITDYMEQQFGKELEGYKTWKNTTVGILSVAFEKVEETSSNRGVIWRRKSKKERENSVGMQFQRETRETTMEKEETLVTETLAKMINTCCFQENIENEISSLKKRLENVESENRQLRLELNEVRLHTMSSPSRSPSPSPSHYPQQPEKNPKEINKSDEENATTEPNYGTAEFV